MVLIRKVKNVLKPFLQRIRRIECLILHSFFKIIFKQDCKKVLFLSASRDTMSGNFYFVYNELKNNYDYTINCSLKKSLKAKKTIMEKINLIKLIAESKYIFLDDYYPLIYPLKLREGTELIQLWHAMGAYKTVGYSRMGKIGGPNSESLTHKNYTAAIVSSESIRQNYAEAFGISIDKIHALGIPRTDIFFDKNYKKNIVKEIYKKYPVLKKKKVVLFAPTFRGKGQKSAYYNFDWIDFKKIKKALGDEYVFVVKLHPFIKNIPDINFDDEFFLDLSAEREINDYLFVTDILVTDYSSVIFEYSFFEKPVVYFMPDLEEYQNSRDFYYPLEKYVYGSIAKNTDSLVKQIKEEKIDYKKVKAFKDYFCSACNGNSTKNVVEHFFGSKK